MCVCVCVCVRARARAHAHARACMGGVTFIPLQLWNPLVATGTDHLILSKATTTINKLTASFKVKVDILKIRFLSFALHAGL